MHLTLTAMLAVTALAGTVAAQGACFVPNGTRRDALTNIGNNKYEPCGSNGHSMCCNVATGDKCQTDKGLCWNEGAKLTWRESCTDPTWQSPKCLKLCVSDDARAANGDPMSGADVVVTQCGDGSYCCGNDNKATECCKSGKGVRIVNGQVVDPSRTTSTAAPSSTSASATASAATISAATASSAPNDGGGSSASNAAVIGGAVGGSLGAVALALVAGFIWYRRRKRSGSREPAPIRQDEYVATETKYQNQAHVTLSPAPQYYPPSELPVDPHPAELGGESIPPNQR